MKCNVAEHFIPSIDFSNLKASSAPAIIKVVLLALTNIDNNKLAQSQINVTLKITIEVNVNNF